MNYIELAIAENKPYPNNPMPVRYYKKAIINDDIDAEDVIRWLKYHNFYNFWINGVYTCHHYHANTHEIIVCVQGEGDIQIGGPNSPIITIHPGDALFLPAGTAHKLVDSTEDFQVVGSYPERIDYDYHREDSNYEEVKRRIANVPAPTFDLTQESLNKTLA